jgi:Pyruvate/2-oxoacid:ferredoxin oxidoreductase gamma subunit
MMLPYAIYFSGYQGQGVTFLAQVLGEAATHEGFYASLLSRYGNGIRGGVTRVQLLLATEPNTSWPESFQAVVCLHPKARQPGIPVGLQALILDAHELGADRIAHQRGFIQGVNMVMLGALLAHIPICSEDVIAWVLKRRLSLRPAQMPANLELLEAGGQLVIL